MRRSFFVVLALATSMLIAVPATAKKGGIPGPPDKPEEGLPVSVTCDSPWWEGNVRYGDFTIYLSKASPDACVDVMTQRPGEWHVTVTQEEGTWRRPELMMVPRDAAFPSDSCGGVKRVGPTVFDPWVLPPEDDARGFTVVPVATVNACPGWDAVSVGGDGVGDYGELVERPDQGSEEVFAVTSEEHPLAFVVWSHGLKKTDRIRIDVDLP